MRVMVIVKASPESEAGILPSPELLAEMGKFNADLVSAGVLVDAAGLKPTSRGVRVRFSGQERTIIDGPFAETKELIGGFWIWKVNSLAEAIEWLKRCPCPHPNSVSEVEIRPFYEPEDFGACSAPGEGS